MCILCPTCGDKDETEEMRNPELDALLNRFGEG